MLNRLTFLQYAALRLIEKSNGGLSGYDINKYLKAKGVSFSHQQIYRTLHELEKAAVLATHIVPVDGKPDRIVYQFKNPYFKIDSVPVDFKLREIRMDVIVALGSYSLCHATLDIIEKEMVKLTQKCVRSIKTYSDVIKHFDQLQQTHPGLHAELKVLRIKQEMIRDILVG
jgi:hypothetical protein